MLIAVYTFVCVCVCVCVCVRARARVCVCVCVFFFASMYGFGPGHIFVPPLLSYHMYVFGPGHIFVSLRFLSGFQTTSGLLIWIQTK